MCTTSSRVIGWKDRICQQLQQLRQNASALQKPNLASQENLIVALWPEDILDIVTIQVWDHKHQILLQLLCCLHVQTSDPMIDMLVIKFSLRKANGHSPSHHISAQPEIVYLPGSCPPPTLTGEMRRMSRVLREIHLLGECSLNPFPLAKRISHFS